MSQQAPTHAASPAARPVLRTRATWLLDSGKLPSVFPASPPALGASAAPAHTVHSHGTVIFGLLRLWLRYRVARLLRPAQLGASGDAIGLRLALYQGFWFDLLQRSAQPQGPFPAAMRAHLLRHARPAPSMTLADIDALVLGDLGTPLAALFSRFDPQPVRVGNYTETYRATLRREEVEVEVRIQRAHLAPRLQRDLRILKLIARLQHRVKGPRRTLFDDIIDGYAERLPALLDLRYEASARRRMRSTLREHKVYVPRLFRAYTSKHILVHEHIAAPSVQELIDLRARDPQAAQGWLRMNGIELDVAGRRVYHSLLRQICEDDFFNQNMVPSNILLLRNSRFAILSCDASASVDKRFLTIFNLAMAALANEAYDKFADMLFLLCDSLPASNLANVRAELIRTVRNYAARAVLDTLGHEEKSLFVLTRDVSAILDRNGIVLDAQMFKLMDAMGSADALVAQCCPRMNHRTELERFAKKAAARQMRSVFAGGVRKAVAGIVGPISELVRFETASVRKKAQNFRASTGKLAYVGATLAKWVGRAVLTGGVYAVWIYLHQHHASVVAPLRHTVAAAHAQNVEHFPVGTWFAVIAGAMLVYSTIRSIRRRLEQEDRVVRGAA
ncbi:AarF/UbiB family protein [Massilia sp. DJPM01]|uniref:AarF/UbiB family protein n=1 Tax=Massilia sp. DJPM01 TaxID=3024404 RepID=UPI00259DBE85|nr:AarF/UbiB family protein [Massilia sp. DJPM01]MDM5177617.1 AarF/UbiB family protein [Massilia sp. DJPM01]